MAVSEAGIHGRPPDIENLLAAMGPVAVAVSGGVDSMTLAFLANRCNPHVVMVHALSPAVPVDATRRVRAYAGKYQWRLTLINAGEMEDPDYLGNPVNRCYYCKRNLYSGISRQVPGQIVSGTNTDDLADFRPGLEAAAEAGVRHPWVEAGIGKAGIREIAAMLGLNDLAELPASPCLSSRVTTGIPINASLLPLIDVTERRLRRVAGPDVRNLRCRIRGEGIAVELDEDTLLANPGLKETLREEVRAVFSGSPFYRFCLEVQVAPYKRGSAFIVGPGAEEKP